MPPALTRMCVGCGKRDQRSALLRLARDADQVVFDRQGSLPGRGAWVHPQAKCLRRGLDAKRLERAFRARNLSVEAAEELARRIAAESFTSVDTGQDKERASATDEESGLEADGHPMSTQR